MESSKDFDKSGSNPVMLLDHQLVARSGYGTERPRRNRCGKYREGGLGVFRRRATAGPRYECGPRLGRSGDRDVGWPGKRGAASWAGSGSEMRSRGWTTGSGVTAV